MTTVVIVSYVSVTLDPVQPQTQTA